MNGEFLQMIADTRGELDNIRKWINAGNQFDSKTILHSFFIFLSIKLCHKDSWA